MVEWEEAWGSNFGVGEGEGGLKVRVMNALYINRIKKEIIETKGACLRIVKGLRNENVQ